MASVLQVFFALPSFQQRYYSTALQHLSLCADRNPSACFLCQMSKLAIGMLSGQYDLRPSDEELREIEAERKAREEKALAVKEGRAAPEDASAAASAKKPARRALQSGVAPRAFKVLVAGKHPEFSTGRQQDSFDYIHHLLEYLRQREHALKSNFDPAAPLAFVQEERLQCDRCKKVRYQQMKTTEISLPIPLPEPLPAKEPPANAPVGKDGKVKPLPKEYPPVAFAKCVDEWSHAVLSEDWLCPSCAVKTTVRKSSRLVTYPEVLMVHMRRFVYEGWVPEKLDIEIQFEGDKQPTATSSSSSSSGSDGDSASNIHFSFDSLRARGLQSGEVELPAGGDGSSSSGSGAAGGRKVADPTIVSNLEAMGFSSFACQRAALAVDNSSAEAASNWLFGHMEDADINDPLPAAAAASSASAGGANDPSEEEILMLVSMGFDPAKCKYALKQCGNSQERAVDWLFSHADEDVPMEDVAAPAQKEEGARHNSECKPPLAVSHLRLLSRVCLFSPAFSRLSFLRLVQPSSWTPRRPVTSCSPSSRTWASRPAPGTTSRTFGRTANGCYSTTTRCPSRGTRERRRHTHTCTSSDESRRKRHDDTHAMDGPALNPPPTNSQHITHQRHSNTSQSDRCVHALMLRVDSTGHCSCSMRGSWRFGLKLPEVSDSLRHFNVLADWDLRASNSTNEEIDVNVSHLFILFLLSVVLSFAAHRSHSGRDSACIVRSFAVRCSTHACAPRSLLAGAHSSPLVGH